MWINHIPWYNKTSAFINRHLKAMGCDLHPSQGSMSVNRSSAASLGPSASSAHLSLDLKCHKVARLLEFCAPCSVICISSYDVDYRLQSP